MPISENRSLLNRLHDLSLRNNGSSAQNGGTEFTTSEVIAVAAYIGSTNSRVPLDVDFDIFLNSVNRNLREANWRLQRFYLDQDTISMDAYLSVYNIDDITDFEREIVENRHRRIHGAPE